MFSVAYFSPGQNTILIRALNHLISGSSSSNPAGLIFKASITYQEPVKVDIDIKPGSDPNSINLGSRGVIPVAILTTAAFDAATVDAATVRFGAAGTEAAPVRWALEDVDNDGDKDMILHFKTENCGFVATSTLGILTGKTLGGQLIKGTDSVRIVPR